MFRYKNKKGYMGIIAILIVVMFAALWMAYLWKNDWFGGGIKAPSLSNQNENNSSVNTTTSPGDINNQLNTLRRDIKNIQDKKDQEVYDNLK